MIWPPRHSRPMALGVPCMFREWEGRPARTARVATPGAGPQQRLLRAALSLDPTSRKRPGCGTERRNWFIESLPLFVRCWLGEQAQSVNGSLRPHSGQFGGRLRNHLRPLCGGLKTKTFLAALAQRD